MMKPIIKGEKDGEYFKARIEGDGKTVLNLWIQLTREIAKEFSKVSGNPVEHELIVMQIALTSAAKLTEFIDKVTGHESAELS